MPGVNPDAGEEGEVGADDPVVEVVEGFGRLFRHQVRTDERRGNRRELGLTARKKSLMSCVM